MPDGTSKPEDLPQAREQAAQKIHEQDKVFLDLFRQWESLYLTVSRLKNDLGDAEREQQRIEERLAKPVPEMLLPAVYQDKVTIHRVLTK